jgi:hypothetical protein
MIKNEPLGAEKYDWRGYRDQLFGEGLRRLSSPLVGGQGFELPVVAIRIQFT